MIEMMIFIQPHSKPHFIFFSLFIWETLHSSQKPGSKHLSEIPYFRTFSLRTFNHCKTSIILVLLSATNFYHIMYWWVSNLIPKKTKKFEFGKNFLAILFEIKNYPYTPIFSLVGVCVGGISD